MHHLVCIETNATYTINLFHLYVNFFWRFDLQKLIIFLLTYHKLIDVIDNCCVAINSAYDIVVGILKESQKFLYTGS